MEFEARSGFLVEVVFEVQAAEVYVEVKTEDNTKRVLTMHSQMHETVTVTACIEFAVQFAELLHLRTRALPLAT